MKGYVPSYPVGSFCSVVFCCLCGLFLVHRICGLEPRKPQATASSAGSSGLEQF